MLGGIAYPEAPHGLNFFDVDFNLRRLLARRAPELLAGHGKTLSSFGAWVGGPLDGQAAYSDRYAPPQLETHTRTGDRLGRVVHNPAYAACHQEAYHRGAIALPFADPPAPHLLSFTLGYLLSQADIAIHCPVTMTGAVAYVLSHHAPRALRESYLPGLIARSGTVPTAATWVTERQGGSDVGATCTQARRAADGWQLFGEKWFASNAAADLALVTARRDGAEPGVRGVGCYLVPTRLADGQPNGVFVRRLKAKLGTRALATGEIELDGAHAFETAPPPTGLPVMMEAIGYSRVHNAMAASAVQRRAFLEAVCRTTHRRAFGAVLREAPMIRDSLLDLLSDLEASACLAFEAAVMFDTALGDEDQRPWLRLTTALAKYWTAKQAVAAATDAVELVGGDGYTEDWPTARLYRDAMVLPVWEGPANIQALEVLRLVTVEREVDALFARRVDAIVDSAGTGLTAEVDAVRTAYARCVEALRILRADEGESRRQARRVMDLFARTLAAALLLEEAAADRRAGDNRKAFVLRRFLGRHFPGDAAAAPREDPALAYFDEIVEYKRV